ncbi:MAG: hypothetical protein WCC41_15120 [Rhodomicrobium sp.]
MTVRVINPPAAMHVETARCLFAIELSKQSWVIGFITPCEMYTHDAGARANEKREAGSFFYLYFMCEKSVPVKEKEVRQILPPLHVVPFPLQAFRERVVWAISHQNRVPVRYPREIQAGRPRSFRDLSIVFL